MKHTMSLRIGLQQLCQQKPFEITMAVLFKVLHSLFPLNKDLLIEYSKGENTISLLFFFFLNGASNREDTSQA